jgi:hypothetical protein
MTITLTREEAQQVLDALEHSNAREPIWKTPIREARETLRARLSAPEPSASVEPVAWVSEDTSGQTLNGRKRRIWWENEDGIGFPIYTTPPQRERVQLGEIMSADEEQLKRIAKLVAPEPEPVAWMVEVGDAACFQYHPHHEFKSTPLYTAPPQRKEWQGLTDEEIKQTTHHKVDGAYDYSFRQGAQWAEVTLKRKNT